MQDKQRNEEKFTNIQNVKLLKIYRYQRPMVKQKKIPVNKPR
jgi:hypothetical protein